MMGYGEAGKAPPPDAAAAARPSAASSAAAFPSNLDYRIADEEDAEEIVELVNAAHDAIECVGGAAASAAPPGEPGAPFRRAGTARITLDEVVSPPWRHHHGRRRSRRRRRRRWMLDRAVTARALPSSIRRAFVECRLAVVACGSPTPPRATAVVALRAARGRGGAHGRGRLAFRSSILPLFPIALGRLALAGGAVGACGGGGSVSRRRTTRSRPGGGTGSLIVGTRTLATPPPQVRELIAEPRAQWLLLETAAPEEVTRGVTRR